MLPVLVGAVVAMAACGGDRRTGDPDLQLRWVVEPSPPHVGSATVRVDVADVDWTPRNGALVVITGLRDSVRMAVDTAVGQGAGQYLAEGFPFVVAGDWVLRTRVETVDGRWTEVDHPVKVAAGGG
jgi:hypothetical protein